MQKVNLIKLSKLVMLALLMFVMSNNLALAVAYIIEPGKHIEAVSSFDKNKAGTCYLLAENVVINLSKNVYGAYECGGYDATDVGWGGIKVGTCHESGSKKAGYLDCAIIANKTEINSKTGQLTSRPYYNNENCAGSGVSKFPIKNHPRLWAASASGGGVGGASMGAATSKCHGKNLVVKLPALFGD